MQRERGDATCDTLEADPTSTYKDTSTLLPEERKKSSTVPPPLTGKRTGKIRASVVRKRIEMRESRAPIGIFFCFTYPSASARDFLLREAGRPCLVVDGSPFENQNLPRVKE